MVHDEREFLAIHDAFRPKIRRYLAGMVGESEADDITQEVFLKVSQSLQRFRGESQLSTWIYRIATNAALDRLRSRRSHIVTVSSLPGEAGGEDAAEIEDRDTWTGEARPEVDQVIIRKEMSACIRGYVEELPEDYRAAIVLSDIAGLKNAEIARILGVSLDAVKIRLHRARARLKNMLEEGCTFYHDERNEFACEPVGALPHLRLGRPGEGVSFSESPSSKLMESSIRKRSELTMKLDERTAYLIAVGASVTANCQPCLERNVGKARELGAEEQEIAEAIGIGKLVRKGAAEKMDNFALNLSEGTPVSASASDKGCGCGG
ncbi:MAG: sigma-70 family RNA polymerase sigma factor [Chloroflexi bacterium]|nr:sigma-70 family RNA polymerase sigma factor [Chloroflexota bacterium]